MSWPIVGIIGVILLFTFSYGVTPVLPSKPIQLSSFLDLNDTPNTYASQAGKLVSVKSTEDGLEFVSASVNSGDTNCSNNALCILTGRVNSGFDANFDKNVYIGGDINFSGDKNHTIGQERNQNLTINAFQFIANVGLRVANLIINANTYAFCVFGTNPCSGMYFSASDGIRGFRLDIAGVPIWYIGTGGGAGVTYQGSRTTNPTIGSGAGLPSSMYVLNTLISAQSTPTDGNIPMINQGTQASPSYERIGARQIDLNIGGKIGIVGGTPTSCSGVEPLVNGVATVNTTCLSDENSMVLITKQSSNGTTPITPIAVGNKVYGTSFDIRDSNNIGDANVFWQIIKLF